MEKHSLLPLAFDVFKDTKLSIVGIVSPLIALMKDQVRKMTGKKKRALYIDHPTKVDVCNSKHQMLYFSTELLLTNPVWRDMLQSDVYCRKLVAFVIDEAHCVKSGNLLLAQCHTIFVPSPIYIILYGLLSQLTLLMFETHFYRGDSFRKEFSDLGDVRSLIPSTVRVMALTATATKSSRREIIKTLRMVRPAIISVSPNKQNITYHVSRLQLWKS